MWLNNATCRTCIAILIFLLLSPLHAQQYGWVKVAQLQGGRYDLQTVEFVDALHGWCAGIDTTYRTIDGGNTWRSVRGPSNADFTDLSFTDSSHGWAVGNFAGAAGLIWRTTGGGISWTEQIAPDTRFILRYWSTSAQNLTNNTTVGTRCAIADTGIMRMTTDGGVSWSRRTLADSVGFVIGSGKIVFVDPLHGWVTAGVRGWQGAILRTVDGGKTWMIIQTPGFTAISFVDTLRGWAIQISNPIDAYRTIDGGITWNKLGQIFDPLWGEPIPKAVSFIDSLNGWMFGVMFYQGDLAGAIFRTMDGGASWFREHVGLTRGIQDGLMLDKYHGWAVGNNGVVLAYRLITNVSEKLSELPTAFALRQNHPNPFNPATMIEYEVSHTSVVSITVYDATGREVRQLVSSTHAPGVYRIRFDGSHLASGEYHFTMRAGSFIATKQMTLLK